MNKLKDLIERLQMFKINLDSFENKYPPGVKRGEIFFRTQKYYKRTINALETQIANYGQLYKVYSIQGVILDENGNRKVFETILSGISEEEITMVLEFNIKKRLEAVLIKEIPLGQIKWVKQ